MTVELIGAITLVVGLISLLIEPAFIVYVFLGSTLLGAAGAIILPSLGGTNIQPAHLLLGFLVLKLTTNESIRSGALNGVTIGRPGFWLLLTTLYSTVSAYLMPRIFSGETLAFAVRAQGTINSAVPLAPTTSNLTQSIYFISNFICFIVLYGFGMSHYGRKHLARAALACVIINLIFVALDLATYATGTGELLSFIRNSTYSLMSEAELAGFKRIVGSFVESSQFSYWTIGYFAFASSLWLYGVSSGLTLTLTVLSLAALIFSTSTTAYVGLAGFLLVRYVTIVGRALFRPVTMQMMLFILCAPFILVFTVVVILLDDGMSSYVGDLLNTMVLNKMSTESGIERSSWNSQAIQNFVDTFGFGAGNGSVRTSSFPIAVIASLGIIGTFTYSLFLLTIWFGQREQENVPSTDAVVSVAARSACLAWLIAASVSGGFIDLGLPFFAFAALGCAPPRTLTLGTPKKIAERALNAL
jgi:hypothetical protein